MLTIDFETYWDKDFSLSKMTTESYIRDPQFEVIGVSIKKCDEVIEHYTREFEVVLKGHLEHERCAQCSTSDAASPGILALLHKLLKIDE